MSTYSYHLFVNWTMAFFLDNGFLTFNKYLLRTYYVPGIVLGAEYVIWLHHNTQHQSIVFTSVKWAQVFLQISITNFLQKKKPTKLAIENPPHLANFNVISTS